VRSTLIQASERCVLFFGYAKYFSIKVNIYSWYTNQNPWKTYTFVIKVGFEIHLKVKQNWYTEMDKGSASVLYLI